ncbi:MerR family transcriptional regulator [Vagococcus sp. DIV0080]|uniref:MerR family transcriptional regulator n=2 Tax=Candidatus Vagococcus giribetii TaxID=2230876 RepID=A0ABS3HQU1_9ENTE|nr:MerR family transcriptional regulator [Vagococcus sp. DIV0080]
MEMLLTTGQLAKLFDIPKYTIRYYIEESLLLPKTNKDNGYHYFDESDVYRLYQILFLRQCDYTIEEIKHLLQEEAIYPFFTKGIAKLEEQINELTRVKEELERVVEENKVLSVGDSKTVKRAKRYLKKIPDAVVVSGQVDLLKAKEQGFGNLELFIRVANEEGEEHIYVFGTQEDYDLVLEEVQYVKKTIEVTSEEQLQGQLATFIKENIHDTSYELIYYENIDVSLGYRDKLFVTLEVKNRD